MFMTKNPMLSTPNIVRNSCMYTECIGRNLPYFGRTFLRVNYIDITNCICIQSWTVWR